MPEKTEEMIDQHAETPTSVVIDDEESICEGCRQILEDEGWIVGVAYDGYDGLQLVRDMRPDIVLVDLKMPGISGMEVLQRIRELDPLIVPIVITGYGTIDTAVEALKKGANDYVCKPFDEKTLMIKAEAGLRSHRQRKSAEALERQKQIAIDNFAAVVCHQLKSPAAAASQWIRMMKAKMAGPLTPEQEEALSRAHKRLTELTDLVGDWLRLASVESFEDKLEAAAVDIEKIIRGVWAKISEEEQPIRIDLIVDSSENARPVSGDAQLLQQLFENLLRNSVKFTSGPGRITVDISIDGAFTVVSVTDTGMGIPEEELPHLFSPFYRGTRAIAKRKEGSGLGLVIAKAIASAHKGTIAAQSKPGEGAIFTVRLPVFEHRTVSEEHEPFQGTS